MVEEKRTVEADIEGVIQSFKLSGDYHKGPYSDSKKVPIVSLQIVDDQGSHKFQLPIDLPTNPLSVRLLELELLNQRAHYQEGNIRGYASGPFKKLEILSGRLLGTNYVLEELVDW